jgi:hypothetical protein
MFQRNQLQASNPARAAAKYSDISRTRWSRTYGDQPSAEAVYPEVPAGWPNRAVRRAVKQNRESRLPQCWKQALMVMPKLRAAIKVL